MAHLRAREGGERVTTVVELFFDLVYVFAVTQLSHLLIGGLSWAGAGRTAFLLLVVWWAWIYTTWMVNWFDPGSAPVRVVLIFVALASLLMAAALPGAFGHDPALFAGAYVVLQVGRNVAGTVLLARDHEWKAAQRFGSSPVPDALQAHDRACVGPGSAHDLGGPARDAH